MKKKNLSFLINKQINKLLFYGDHFLLVYSFAGLVAISCEPESILLTREFSRAISPEWRLVRAFVCPCDLTFLPTFFHLEFIHRLSKGGRGRGSAARMAQDQCGPGSNPAVDAICGLSLLLVLSLAPRGFSPGTPVFPSPQKPTLQNSNSIWNARARFNKFISTPKYFVGKQITIHNFYNWRRQTKKKQTNKQATKRNQALRKTSSLYKPRGELHILKEWGCSSEILN